MTAPNYELLDFGNGRKLERFGDILLDRPCPAAEGVTKSRPELWRTAAARFEPPRRSVALSETTDPAGRWTNVVSQDWPPADWSYQHTGVASFQLKLDPLPSGQIGVFPEQRDNWDWIAKQVAKSAPTKREGEAPAEPQNTGTASGTQADRLRVLNLFAYTGGSTLAAASAGAPSASIEVVHVDAARNIVDRARTNAEVSGLADRPIRWIVEDALKFCRRELKRGNGYNAVIVDPPSYGHGPKGEPWKITEHLLPLLEVCGQLTANERAFILLTCHTPGIGPAELAAYLADGIFGNCSQPPASGELFLRTNDGRKLPNGVFARWPR